jgi:hypothetical protein
MKTAQNPKVGTIFIPIMAFRYANVIATANIRGQVPRLVQSFAAFRKHPDAPRPRRMEGHPSRIDAPHQDGEPQDNKDPSARSSCTGLQVGWKMM